MGDKLKKIPHCCKHRLVILGILRKCRKKLNLNEEQSESQGMKRNLKLTKGLNLIQLRFKSDTAQIQLVAVTNTSTPPSSLIPQSISVLPIEGEEMAKTSTTLATPSTSPQKIQSATPIGEISISPNVFKMNKHKG